MASYIGHEPRSAGTLAYLDRLVTALGDTPLAQVDQAAADQARAALFKPDAAPATIRRGLFTPLTAVLNHAAHPARKWCDQPRFDIPAEPRGRTEFMLPDQVAALLDGADPRVREILRFLVCTGCRVSEAIGLDWRDVDLAARRAILWEGETKSGNRRIVEIYPAAAATLAALPQREGRVFLTHRGQPYRDSDEYGGQLKSSWRTAVTAAGLADFTPHHLRHTWASWHYAVHRDLLKLKVDGGWQRTTMCERYAHVMPIGHEAAIRAIWGLESRGNPATPSEPFQPIGEIEYF